MEDSKALDSAQDDPKRVAETIEKNSIASGGIKLAENVFTWMVTPEMIKAASEIIKADSFIPSYWIDKYEKDVVKNWDKFYKENTSNFFKDRMWIGHEFPELNIDTILPSQSSLKDPESAKRHPENLHPFLLEVGCGVGNALIPVLQCYPHLSASGFDCSCRAINLLKERWYEICKDTESKPEDQVNKKIGHLFRTAVFDVLKGPIPASLYPEDGVDFILVLFVLSALPPSQFSIVCQRIKECLRPNGILLFRDYARYDMTQLRFAQSKRALVRNNFYVRQDGTLAYYFTIQEILHLFSEHAGLECLENVYIQKQIINRKTGKEMKRIWIQARFKRPAQTDS